ncbi:MAG: DUF4252 domain-containing protein, partial [Tenacibaculum sp.]
MRKVIIYSLLLLAFVTVSCKNEASLQSYLVESQDKKGFVTLDVPASVLTLSLDKASQEDKKAYESIRKINITGLPYKDTDEATYQTEKEKIKAILSKSDYKQLVSLKKDGVNATIYYTGNSEAIDEIVAFGYSKKMGVGIARLLGDNMNPGKIMEMMKNAKIDADNMDLGAFSSIFKENKMSM